MTCKQFLIINSKGENCTFLNCIDTAARECQVGKETLCDDQFYLVRQLI